MPGKNVVIIMALLVWLIALRTLPSRELNDLALTQPSHPSNPLQTGELTSPTRNFEIEKLAAGVYAVIRKEPPGLMVDANNVVIINDDGVVVVDSNGAPSITREV